MKYVKNQTISQNMLKNQKSAESSKIIYINIFHEIC